MTEINRPITNRSVRFNTYRLAGVGVAALAASLWLLPARAAPAPVPAPAADEPAASANETVILAGGCFWGVQGVFQHVKGVIRATSGYTGGKTANPSYDDVSTGRTGHAESVEVTFDPHVVSYGQILRIFFSAALDPTELNYQGPDHGTQYRSAVFTTTPAQSGITKAYVAQLDKAHVFPAKIVTEITPAGVFYPAEDYHQNYATLHPDSFYIAVNDLPKIAAVKALFPSEYLDKPVLLKTAGAAD